MIRKSFVVFAVSAVVAAAAIAASGEVQKSTVTVGDFAIKVSSALGKPAASPGVAVESLKSMGVKIGDASASLTEGMASKIMADLGLRVTTANPGGSVTAGKADQMAAIVGLSTSLASTLPASELPPHCLQSRNRGICVDCCNAVVGCDPNNPDHNCSPCAKFCKSVLPPGQQSPSDPEP